MQCHGQYFRFRFTKLSVLLAFFGNDVYMMAPFKVITECDSKVFGIFHSLNGCITEFIFLDVWKSGTVNCKYIIRSYAIRHLNFTLAENSLHDICLPNSLAATVDKK